MTTDDLREGFNAVEVQFQENFLYGQIVLAGHDGQLNEADILREFVQGNGIVRGRGADGTRQRLQEEDVGIFENGEIAGELLVDVLPEILEPIEIVVVVIAWPLNAIVSASPFARKHDQVGEVFHGHRLKLSAVYEKEKDERSRR